MAEILGIEKNTVLQRLYVAKIKPLTKEAIYPKSALESIRNVPGKGRPKTPIIKQVLKAQEAYKIAIIAGDTRVREKETIFTNSLTRFMYIRKSVPQDELNKLFAALDPKYAKILNLNSFTFRGIDGSFVTSTIKNLDKAELIFPELAIKPKKRKPAPKKQPKSKK